MSANDTNAQGTLAWASGALFGAGVPAALTTTGPTQIIAALFAFTGAVLTVVRAWLRSP